MLLVIDNQAGARAELALVLNGKYEVAAVGSSREALDLVAFGAKIDVVVCRLTMPEMDGAQLCLRLREIESDLASRVVLIADGTPDAETRGALAGLPNRCLTRPLDPESLIDAIERCRAGEQRLEQAADGLQTRLRRRPFQSYSSVFALSVRLLREEALHLVDEDGWPWVATATTLELRRLGSTQGTTMTRGCAADIALEIVRRGLRLAQEAFGEDLERSA
jgi:DNA-binding NarL/FixJ family response regulator